MKKLKNVVKVKMVAMPSAVVSFTKIRSNEGFEKFLDRVYVNKHTGGKFLSVKSYLWNLKFLMNRSFKSPNQFHKLSNVELYVLYVNFRGTCAKNIDVRTINNIQSTYEAYKEYVRFTKGLYNQVRLAA